MDTLHGRKTCAIAAFALTLSAGGAMAQSSFDFDAGLEGWRGDGFGQVAWSELDARFRTDSGSVLVTNDNVRICLPLTTPSLHHVLEAQVLIPPGQGGFFLPAINVGFHPQPNCTGSRSLHQANIDPANAVDGWLPLKMDTRAFFDPLADIVPPGTQSAELLLFVNGGTAYFDEVRFYGYSAIQGGAYPCAPHTFTACLGANRRFQVDVSWETDNQAGFGYVVPQSEDSATVWFFDKDNTELLVKVLDGCAINGYYWVFAAGLTNVAVTLEVLDTFTDELASYESDFGDPFGPELDTEAFDTCP